MGLQGYSLIFTLELNNGEDAIWHGSLCSNTVVHHSNYSIGGPSSIKLTNTTMGLPDASSNPTDEPHHESHSLLFSTPYGSNIYPLVPTHKLIQSIIPICHTQQPIRSTESTRQPSTNTPSSSKRTR